MRRKTKTRKKPTPPAPLNQEQEALISILLQKIWSIEPVELVARVPDSVCAQALINRLPLDDESPIPLLLALKARFEDKGVGKAIKSALFKLKRKGVSTEKFHTEAGDFSTALKPVPKEPPRCYVGSVDGTGSRAVVITVHRGGKGLDIGLGVVSDEKGIQEFFYRNLGRKSANVMKESFSREVKPLVDTSLAHTATILEESYQRHLTLKSDVPADYLELRPWLLENATFLTRPVVYDCLTETSISDSSLTDFQLMELFDNELMVFWFIEFKALRPFMEDIFKVRESPIVLTEAQKANRIREIKEECMGKLFSPEKRELLKRRLEEMGYVFLKLGEEETAGLALAAAHTVDMESTILKTNPVIEILLERSLRFYTRTMKEADPEQVKEESESSPIILP